MVLHQRTKQACQSKDLSVPYSPCWSLLLAPFEASAKDHPLVAAWLLFVNDSKHEQDRYGRTTSQQQAVAFKRLGRWLAENIKRSCRVWRGLKLF